MPRNVLSSRSLRELATEYVLRYRSDLAPVKLYSTADITEEMFRRWDSIEIQKHIDEAWKIAKIMDL